MIAAIQGAVGSFSEGAARQELGDQASIECCDTFDQLFAMVASGVADIGVVPVHNSIAGPVYDNSDRIRRAHFRTVGRVSYPVQQCLIARPGTSLDAVRRVASHPMALLQCARYLRARPTMAARTISDTAGGVRDMMTSALEADAVIASATAASHYGAVVLAEGIQDDPENFTEFVLIAAAA